jgi:hypothetical protein
MKKIINLSLIFTVVALAFSSANAFDIKYFPTSKTRPVVSHLPVEKGCKYDVVYNEYFREYSVNYICNGFNAPTVSTPVNTSVAQAPISIPVTVNNNYTNYTNTNTNYTNANSVNSSYNNSWGFSFPTNWYTPSWSYNWSMPSFSNLWSWDYYPDYSYVPYTAGYEYYYEPIYESSYPTFFSPSDYVYEYSNGPIPVYDYTYEY